MSLSQQIDERLCKEKMKHYVSTSQPQTPSPPIQMVIPYLIDRTLLI
jgi:hypothetical protein